MTTGRKILYNALWALSLIAILAAMMLGLHHLLP